VEFGQLAARGMSRQLPGEVSDIETVRS